MPSLLEQLGNEQALLMHLAEELPPDDAAELDELLQTDARLREEMQALRSTYEQVFSSIATLDRVEPLPVAGEIAMRGVRRRLNHQRLADDTHITAVDPSLKKSLRYPWWAYPMATAAAVLLAFLVWWGNSSYSPHWFTQPGQTALNDEQGPGQGTRRRWHGGGMQMDPQLRQAYIEEHQQRLAQWLRDSFSGDEINDASAERPLSRAEEQLALLTEPKQQDFPLPPTNQ